MSDMAENLSAHKLELARTLLDDIELSRLTPDALLLKGRRLARLIGDSEVEGWLGMELRGYDFSNEERASAFADAVGRWTDQSKKLGHWWPLAEIEARITALHVELKQCRVPDVQLNLSSANPHEMVTGWGGSTAQQVSAPVEKILKWMETTTSEIHGLTGIRSRVLARLHGFAATTYYELAFSAAAASVFDGFQADVDQQLAILANETRERFPAVSERLATGDAEAISHAMTTCRRIVDHFADAVFPPKDEALILEGNTIGLGPSNHLNRLNAYIAELCASNSRRTRLRKTLRELYSRVSAGVHSDVTEDEARALFIQTYVTLGEIALLGRVKQ